MSGATLIAALAFLNFGLVGFLGHTLVADETSSGIRVEVPWARASIGLSRPAVAYLTIVNFGSTADRLVGVSTPAARRAEVHRVTINDGVMRMAPAGPVPIPAGARVELKPGGLHIMLMKLHAPLKKGTTLPLTLHFEKKGEVSVTAKIAGPGARRPPG